MRIESISNTTFSSNKKTVIKDLYKISNDKKSTDIKPIKNYTQYLREYGLISNTRKKQ